ncbi:polysaccharide pyruvyl transferase CsaB [Feifania hominis]|uniref:Polysaccharide pyruvyl transferase CsaB n=1 Tax=Feifania hominis TaxID=2763660 RepID=A0A926HV55_9FIRM|nr:polysaccharide pyruvyl transferase CsaB [Feifania hominis]MBC8536988.1 polysaccharide pyruvyl transferase CsaB [Feifania hominis]
MHQTKILMTTMGLGLGGAETHIVELSKELARKGYEIVVCSNGGVYVDELERHGIRHYQAPMHVRSVPAMVKSFFRLLSVIRRERPDVVHAHARIPGFLSSIACALTGTPMVTTAHFNFKTTGGLRFLTRWGKKSIAVSEDLKKYLTSNYNLHPSDVRVTVNGINTGTFCPGQPVDDLRAELGLPADARVILTVSRMDYNACKSAFLLVDCAEELCRAHPDVRIVIVGSGDALEDVRERAEAVNRRLGERHLILTGGRTDISRLAALCDIFVGVSRAALEAMSCAKPVVLAGNQGYLGLYTEDKLPDCVATNFTCRDIPYPSERALLEELDALLARPVQELERLGAVGRERVLASYSVSRMADDAIYTYRDILCLSGKRKYDYIVCGYYGYANAGDDTMLSCLVENLNRHRPGVSICVLVRDPETRVDLRVASLVNRFHLFKVRKAIRNSRVLIFGGGNLIQDATSTKSLLYYLALLRLAYRYGLRTMLYANGIGPITKPKNRRRAGQVLDRLDLVTLREPNSAQFLKELGVTHPRVEVTADEVFTLFEGDRRAADAPVSGLPEGDIFVVSLREWPTLDAECLAKLTIVLKNLSYTYSLTPVILALHESTDLEISKLLHENVPGSVLPTGLSSQEIMQIIARSQFVIGMRLHSLIFATGAGVPTIGIVYDPKVSDFLEYIGVSRFLPCEQIDTGELLRMAADIMSRRAELGRELGERSRALIADAALNAVYAAQLLDGEEPS